MASKYEHTKAGDACPKCGDTHGGIVIEKTVTKEGAKSYGRRFLGCQRFPHCKHPPFKWLGSAAESAAAQFDVSDEVANENSTPSMPEPTPQPSKAQAPENGNADADRLSAVLADILNRPAGLDENAVTTIVKRVVAERAPQVMTAVVEVRVPDRNMKQIEGQHFMFARLLKLIGAGFNVFLHGPPGTGKTTAALNAAKALDREAEIDTMDPTTSRSMVQGFRTPNGEPVHTQFTRCWESGKVYVADELDLAPGRVQTLLNSALSNGHAPLAWGNVERRDNFAFVGTGNTAGGPTTQFPDRQRMSEAFKDRLYFLHWPIDPTIESRLGGNAIPAPTRDEPRPVTNNGWVEYVRAMRTWAATNAPTLQVTPRASIEGLKAFAAGESAGEVADGLIFRGCDPEIRKRALAAVRLPA